MGQIAVAANTDLNNLGGVIAANNNLVARAGRDLNIASTTRTQNNAQGSRTNRDRIAGLYVTGSTGELLASAGRDLTLTAAQVQSSGRAALGANHNLHLNTVQEAQNTTIVWNGANHRSDASRAEAGTQIQTQGDLTLQAGNDLTAKAANVTSSQGSLAATAGNDLTLAAAQASIQLDEAHRHKGGGFLSKKTRATRDTLEQTTAQGTTLSGNRVSVVAGHDLTLTGSNVVSDRGTELAAQRDLTLEAATNATLETHFKAEKKSGLMGSGGIGFSIGTQQQSNDQKGAATLTAATTVGSTQGNIDLRAGKTYTQSGSDLLAPQGDIGVNAQRIDILEARETSQSRTETKFRQSGLTLALSSPVISAIQTVDQMRRAAKDTADPRMQALAAGAAGLAGYGAYKQVKAGQGTTLNGKDNQIATGKTNPDGTPETRDADLADKMGGVSVSISLGNSKSESHSTRTGDTARGSTLVTGGDVTLTAKAGKGEEEREKGDGDLTVVGSDIKAGRNVSLEADHKITLRAAQNSASQTSHNTSSSNSLGIGFALGGQSNGFTLNLAASRARGNADGDDVSYSNIRLEAGNQLTLKSGGDTALQGAVASGKQITAAIGGNLAIESLQDTSTYQSEQKSAGFSASIPIYGTGGSASVNVSKSRIDSDYASVTEQSGIKAGDAGFDVRVKGNTDLTGGAITSMQAALDENRNRFTTASLTTSDLQNHARYKATAVGINLGTGVSLDGKLAPQGTSAGLGRDSGNAGSLTQAAITGIAGNKEARTGDKETGIGQIFDADKVQKEISAQVQITREFGRQAGRAVGDYAATKLEAAKKNNDQAGIDAWSEGGSARVALHAVVGGLTGGVQGAAGAATSQTAVPLIGDALREADLPLEIKQALVLAAGATVGAATGGTAGAAAGFNATANNYLYLYDGKIIARDRIDNNKIIVLSARDKQKLAALEPDILMKEVAGIDSDAAPNLVKDERSAQMTSSTIYNLSNTEERTQLQGQTDMGYINIDDQSTRIYVQTGMNTKPEDALKNAQALSKLLGEPVGVIVNSTQGLPNDVQEYLPKAPSLKDALNEYTYQTLNQQGGKMVVMHSAGNEDANKALQLGQTLGHQYGDLSFISLGSPVSDSIMRQGVTQSQAQYLGQVNDWRDPVTNPTLWVAGTGALLISGAIAGTILAPATGGGSLGVYFTTLAGGGIGGGIGLYGINNYHPLDKYIAKPQAQSIMFNWQSKQGK